jgi:hypothetical protein
MCIFLGEQDNGLSRYVSHHVMTLSLSLSIYTHSKPRECVQSFSFSSSLSCEKDFLWSLNASTGALCCSNLLDVRACVCVCVSFLLRRCWSNASAKEIRKRTWTWCLAQSVLIRSVIQTAVGRPDRIHHWIQNFFSYFLSLYSFHSFNALESE